MSWFSLNCGIKTRLGQILSFKIDNLSRNVAALINFTHRTSRVWGNFDFKCTLIGAWKRLYILCPAHVIDYVYAWQRFLVKLYLDIDSVVSRTIHNCHDQTTFRVNGAETHLKLAGLSVYKNSLDLICVAVFEDCVGYHSVFFTLWATFDSPTRQFSISAWRKRNPELKSSYRENKR